MPPRIRNIANGNNNPNYINPIIAIASITIPKVIKIPIKTCSIVIVKFHLVFSKKYSIIFCIIIFFFSVKKSLVLEY